MEARAAQPLEAKLSGGWAGAGVSTEKEERMLIAARPVDGTDRRDRPLSLAKQVITDV